MDAAPLLSRGASLVHVSEWTRGAIACLAAIGIALRLVQYLNGGALWMDELALARNIVDRDWRALFGEPLIFGQVAPAGFLLAEKAVITIFGSENDVVLRMVPFAAAVATLIVFWRLTEGALGGRGALLAMMLFVTAVPLVFFAAQVKQYSTDVFASTLIVFVGMQLDSPALTRRQVLTYAAIGAMAAWLSYPALLVIGVTGLVVLLRALWCDDRWARVRPLAVVMAIWGASVLASLMVATSAVPADLRGHMMDFWSAGFPPARDPWTLARWSAAQIESLVGTFGTASLRYPAPRFYVALAAVGALVLVWRRHVVGQIAVGTGVVALAAAIAGEYPFAERLALYLLPLALLVIAAGVQTLQEWLARRVRHVAVFAPMLIVPCLLPMVQSPPPYQLENVHPAMRHLQLNRQPGDQIYVYYGAMLSFDFYASRYGFSSDSYVAGSCHRPDNREYLREVDMLRGAPRVWVFFSHAVPRYGDREDLVGYLDTIGRRMQRTSSDGTNGRADVEVYLYDLSDPLRLASSDADRYEIRGPEPAVPPCAPRVPRREEGLVVDGSRGRPVQSPSSSGERKPGL